MKYYRIYGLNLTVNIALPGPIAVDLPLSDLPVVNVVMGRLPSWPISPDPGMPPNWYSALKPDGDGEITVSSLQVWQIDAPINRTSD